MGLSAVAALAIFADQARRDLAPFDVTMPPLDGSLDVAAGTPIVVEAVGLGAHLAAVEFVDEQGRMLAQVAGVDSFALPSPLAFGLRYRLSATVERPWLGQRLTREIAFSTEAMPRLEGAAQRDLTADASLSLHFDRPIGELQIKGDMRFEVQADDKRENFRLAAVEYAQGQTHSIQLDMHTAAGTPLPPLSLEVNTPPPFSVEKINLQGVKNLGVKMPLRLYFLDFNETPFNETPADRQNAGKKIQVRTEDGKPISGKWEWLREFDKNKKPVRWYLQFTPQPSWPVSSGIQVRAERSALLTERGGFLDKPLTADFSTGPDRRIFVYLDRQQVEAVENGQVVRTFKVSTGKSKTPTVTGNFYIYDRYTRKTMRSSRIPKGAPGYYEVENVPYTQFFHKDYALHGAWWHNGFGHPASHGCVNMATRSFNKRWPNSPEDAGWLYQWATLGVPVTVLRGTPMQMAHNGNG
jgi:lipoprotein-anchoring transpeptidase ErfK/SrfK